MLRFSSRLATGVFLACVSFCAHADDPSPAGLWKNIDDATGKPAALIRISQTNGEYSGQIEKLFRKSDEEQNPVCDRCEGPRHGQPIVGMTILSGLKHVQARDHERGAEKYEGGQILDPGNGKTYRCNMTLSADGRQLEVRGYIGVPMLGRTQTWVRMP